jgi:hypothetical protein
MTADEVYALITNYDSDIEDYLIFDREGSISIEHILWTEQYSDHHESDSSKTYLIPSYYTRVEVIKFLHLIGAR